MHECVYGYRHAHITTSEVQTYCSICVWNYIPWACLGLMYICLMCTFYLEFFVNRGALLFRRAWLGTRVMQHSWILSHNGVGSLVFWGWWNLPFLPMKFPRLKWCLWWIGVHSCGQVYFCWLPVSQQPHREKVVRSLLCTLWSFFKKEEPVKCLWREIGACPQTYCCWCA